MRIVKAEKLELNGIFETIHKRIHNKNIYQNETRKMFEITTNLVHE